jgi:hypothetical protein
MQLTVVVAYLPVGKFTADVAVINVDLGKYEFHISLLIFEKINIAFMELSRVRGKMIYEYLL